MKRILTYLAAAILLLGVQSLRAQSTTNSAPGLGHHDAATPEQRKERMAHLLKALDLTAADLKGLSREERQTKMKDAAEKVSADLKAKKSAGELTEEQQKRLDIVDKYLAHSQKKASKENN